MPRSDAPSQINEKYNDMLSNRRIRSNNRGQIQRVNDQRAPTISFMLLVIHINVWMGRGNTENVEMKLMESFFVPEILFMQLFSLYS